MTGKKNSTAECPGNEMSKQEGNEQDDGLYIMNDVTFISRRTLGWAPLPHY